MNGEPLPHLHGAPARLVVPGWVGDDWVKWLQRITLAEAEDGGFYMQTAYRLPALQGAGTEAMTEMPVKSLIARPLDGAIVGAGRQEATGVAFSGGARLDRVELSVDEGRSWIRAELDGPDAAGAWRVWRAVWSARAPGALALWARARPDAAGAHRVEPRRLSVELDRHGPHRGGVVSGAWRVIAAAALAFGGTATATYVATARPSPRLSPPPEQSLTEGAAPAPRSSDAARDLLRARCEVCHAPDLIVAQHLSPEEWTAEIAKMRRWGARLSDSEAADLARDLAEHLGVDAGDQPGGRLDAREVADHDAPQTSPWPPGSVERGAIVFQEACAACHGSDGRGGTREVRAPALVGRLIVQRPLDFEAAVRRGLRDMPSFGATLSPSQMADLFAWVGRESVPEAGNQP